MGKFTLRSSYRARKINCKRTVYEFQR